MCIFKNRPWALASLCFALVGILAYSLSLVLCIVLCFLFLMLACVCAIFYFKKKERAFFLSFLCIGAVTLSLFSSVLFFHTPRTRLEATVGKQVVLDGYVLRTVSLGSNSSVYDVVVRSLDGKEEGQTVRVNFEFAAGLSLGDCFVARMTGEEMTENGYGSNRDSLFSDGIFAIFVCKDGDELSATGETADTLPIRFLRWRQELSLRLEYLIGGEEGALASALLLGDRSFLSDDTVLAFRRCGISHLLALSGLHISILIGFLEMILTRIRARRSVRAVCIILLSVFYLFLTGCAPSTVRAVIMVTVISLGFVFRGDYDSFTSLMTALVLILFYSPYAARDLSLWMSFLAAGSIILFLPPIHRWMREFFSKHNLPSLLSKGISSVLLAVFVGATANLGLLLVQAAFFGEYSLLSIPVTILLSFPLSLVLVLSILCGFCPPIGFLCRGVASLMLFVASELSALQGILLPIGDAASLSLILLLTLLLILIAVLRLPFVHRWIFAVMVSSLLLLPCSYMTTEIVCTPIKVSYLCDIEEEALILNFRGECTVIDLSASDAANPYSVVATVQEERCTEIGELVLTHYQNSHASYVRILSGRVRVRRLILPTPCDAREAAIAKRIADEAALHNVSVSYGFESIGTPMRSAELLCYEPDEVGDRLSRFFSISVGKQRLTYFNVAFFESNQRSTEYRKLLEQSDALIIDAEGASSMSSKILPKEILSAERLILSKKSMRSLIPTNVSRSVVSFGSADYLFE